MTERRLGNAPVTSSLQEVFCLLDVQKVSWASQSLKARLYPDVRKKQNNEVRIVVSRRTSASPRLSIQFTLLLPVW